MDTSTVIDQATLDTLVARIVETAHPRRIMLFGSAARRRSSGKRGGAGDFTVTFDEAVQRKPSGAGEILALNSALDALARMNPRQAVMVESRFFGGFDIPETAALLNVSEATVLRDWRAAKAWLAHELRQGL